MKAVILSILLITATYVNAYVPEVPEIDTGVSPFSSFQEAVRETGNNQQCKGFEGDCDQITYFADFQLVPVSFEDVKDQIASDVEKPRRKRCETGYHSESCLIKRPFVKKETSPQKLESEDKQGDEFNRRNELRFFGAYELDNGDADEDKYTEDMYFENKFGYVGESENDFDESDDDDFVEFSVDYKNEDDGYDADSEKHVRKVLKNHK